MFLLNSCLSLFSAAPSLGRSFSRSYGAVLPSSLTTLLPPALGFSPHLPVSVYGTGPYRTIAAFLGSWLTRFATISSLRITALHYVGDLLPTLLLCLHRSFHSRLALSLCVPTVLSVQGAGILNLLSIDYAFRPCLRSRLTQGRSALPWKPQIFGREDSHLTLATHSGILSSCHSTAPCRYSFAAP